MELFILIKTFKIQQLLFNCYGLCGKDMPPILESSQVSKTEQQKAVKGGVPISATRYVYNRHSNSEPVQSEKSCVVSSVFKHLSQTLSELNRTLEAKLPPRVSYTGVGREAPVSSAPSPPPSLYPDITRVSSISPSPSPGTFRARGEPTRGSRRLRRTGRARTRLGRRAQVRSHLWNE